MHSSRFPRALRLLAFALPACGICTAVAQFPDAPRPDLPPLSERRAAVLKEFDLDRDGRLNQAERESARKAWTAKRMAERGDRGFFGPPPELLEEFDTNKDGELDPDEARVAGQTMERRFRQLQIDYDKNGDKELDPSEIGEALRDLDAGKLKGIPRMFLQMAAGGPPRRRPNAGPNSRESLSPREIISNADKDQDGRLSESELQEARAALAERRAAMEKNNP